MGRLAVSVLLVVREPSWSEDRVGEESTVTGENSGIPGFGGDAVVPADDRYEGLRSVYNAAGIGRPQVILRCAGNADVIAAVRFASERRLPLSVYGGGHGVVGGAAADGGVVIDLRPMSEVWVDWDSATAQVRAGTRWAELDRETQVHGLAVTGARISTVGVAGFTLGGGSGWLERALGLTVDSLEAVEMVSADGDLVTASDSSHEELFWALRGGGGNFGVVTSLRFRLRPLGPHLLAGLVLHAHNRARDALAFYRDFIAQAPAEVGGGAALMIAPPAPFVPEAAWGRPVLGIVACYAGALEDGLHALAPLREFGPPMADVIGPMPYTALQGMLDAAATAGAHNHWHGLLLKDLTPDAADSLIAHTAAMPSAGNHVIIEPVGGALHRVTGLPLNDALREARFKVHVIAHGPASTARANVAWADDLASALTPSGTGRRFPGYESAVGGHLLERTFGAENFSRLKAVKRRYDPNGLFTPDQPLLPTSVGAPA